MLATLGPLPREDGSWVYEVKWDGVRAVCSVAGGELRIRSRSGRDITRSWPELAGLPEALGGRDAVLDGEMVAFDPDTGLPSFQVLQGRIHLASRYAIEAAAVDTPVNLVLFDLLSLDGESLLARPYTERRAALVGAAARPRAVDRPGRARRRRRPARRDARARPRGSRRQEAHIAIPARPPRPVLGQGQERPARRADDRRLAPRRGPPQRPLRRRRRRRAPGRRHAALRRPRRQRLRRGAADRHARAPRRPGAPVLALHRPPAAEGDTLRRARVCAAMSSTSSGAARGRCGRRCTRGWWRVSGG